MFWPAGDFLLTGRIIAVDYAILGGWRSFPTFGTGLRSGVFDTRNA